MAEPKWNPEEKKWIQRAAREAGEHPRRKKLTMKDRKRRQEWMRTLRQRTLEKKRHEREMAKQKAS